MSGQWETVREAIATKLVASTGCAAAGLRTADASSGPLNPPHIRVLPVSAYTLTDRPTAAQEVYELTIPAELVVAMPSEPKRSNPVTADIARAVQVEWQTGIKLGLPTYVIESMFTGYQEGLQEFEETGMDGGRLTFEVHVRETLTPIRSA